MSKKAAITLHVRQDADRLTVDVHNGSKAAITLVTHVRYWLLEVLDARGEFVRGEISSVGMPGKKDFADVAPGRTGEGVLGFEIARDEGAVSIGPWSFAAVPDKIELRLTYRTDAIVPNLPSTKRNAFFRGPLQSDRLELTA